MSQADAAPITGNYKFAPVKSAGIIAAQSPTATRRSLLAGMAFAPIAFAGSTSSRAASPSKWKENSARYRAAQAEWDQFLERVYNPAVDRLIALAPTPPSYFTIAARNGKAIEYWYDRKDPDAWTNNGSPLIAEKAKAQADSWRRWEITHTRARHEIGMDAIEAEDTRRSLHIDRLRNELMATPVVNASELLEKLTILWAEGSDPEIFRDHIFGDVRRLSRELDGNSLDFRRLT